MATTTTTTINRHDSTFPEPDLANAIPLHALESQDASAQNESPLGSNEQTESAAEVPLSAGTKLKLLSAAFAFFVAGVNDGSLGALIPYILRAYNIETSFMAIPYGCAFTGWVLAALIGGYARTLLGSGGAMIVGAGVQLLAQTLRPWTPPFGLFSVTFFLIALGQAFQDAQANTFVSAVKGAHRWLGVIHGSYGVGTLVGPLIAAAMASNDPNWAYFYLVPIGLGVANLVAVCYAFRDDVNVTVTVVSRNEGEPRRSGRTRDAVQELKAAGKEKAVWLLSIFFFFYLGAAITASGWLVEFLVTFRHGKLSQVGYLPSAYSGGIALGRILLAEPTHRWGEKRMILLYAVLSLALQVVFWRVPNIIVDAVMVSLMGFLLSPSFPVGVSVATKLLPKEIHASALGLIFVVAQAGGALFPAITGIIAAYSGVQTLQPILVGLLAATVLSWSVVPNPRRKAE